LGISCVTLFWRNVGLLVPGGKVVGHVLREEKEDSLRQRKRFSRGDCIERAWNCERASILEKKAPDLEEGVGEEGCGSGRAEDVYKRYCWGRQGVTDGRMERFTSIWLNKEKYQERGGKKKRGRQEQIGSDDCKSPRSDFSLRKERPGSCRRGSLLKNDLNTEERKDGREQIWGSASICSHIDQDRVRWDVAFKYPGETLKSFQQGGRHASCNSLSCSCREIFLRRNELRRGASPSCPRRAITAPGVVRKVREGRGGSKLLGAVAERSREDLENRASGPVGYLSGRPNSPEKEGGDHNTTEGGGGKEKPRRKSRDRAWGSSSTDTKIET